MFIFVRCLRSSAAVTPVKYERDIVQVTGVFVTLKNCENNGTEEISLVTPTPDCSVWQGQYTHLTERNHTGSTVGRGHVKV